MKAFIGIGSNIGDGIRNCSKAISMIDNIIDCSVLKISSFYKTQPVGYIDQNWFVNCVVLVNTGLSPYGLLYSLQEIENIMGRKRFIKWGPRIIDLDIIMCEDMIISSEDLIIPHPLMHTRRFVLIPMNQIAPEITHPVYNMTIKELLNNTSESGQMVSLIRE